MHLPRRPAGRVLLLALLAAALAGAVDLTRAPERQAGARAAIAAIHLYQRTVSPRLARHGVQCRFKPSCSAYAEASIRKAGLLKGGWRTAVRVARCGPWTPLGTVDEP